MLRACLRVMHGRIATISAFGVGLGVAAGSATQCDWFKSDSPTDTVFESCSVIGDGLKAEIWKRRHKNIDVLEPENVHVQLLMTKLRDGNIPRKGTFSFTRAFGDF